MSEEISNLSNYFSDSDNEDDLVNLPHEFNEKIILPKNLLFNTNVDFRIQNKRNTSRKKLSTKRFRFESKLSTIENQENFSLSNSMNLLENEVKSGVIEKKIFEIFIKKKNNIQFKLTESYKKISDFRLKHENWISFINPDNLLSIIYHMNDSKKEIALKTMSKYCKDILTDYSIILPPTKKKNITSDLLILNLTSSLNGKYLAASHENGSLSLWKLSSLTTPPRKIEAHKGPARCLTFEDQGLLLISGGSDDRIVKVWNIEKNTVLYQEWDIENKYASPMNDIASRGEFIAACFGNGEIHVWKLNYSSLQMVLNIDEAPVNSICFSKNEEFLISAGDNQKVIFFFYLSIICLLYNKNFQKKNKFFFFFCIII